MMTTKRRASEYKSLAVMEDALVSSANNTTKSTYRSLLAATGKQPRMKGSGRCASIERLGRFEYTLQGIHTLD